MFGLINNIKYRCFQPREVNDNDYKAVANVLFKIDSEDFMKVITSEANTFKHFFNIAL